jgi:hypothetical protein
VLPLSSVLPALGNMHYVVTGSTDEKIRVWDLSSIELLPRTERVKLGREGATGLVRVLDDGHFDEVNELKVWFRKATQEVFVMSASLDGTLRRWRLKELLSRPGSEVAVAKGEEEPKLSKARTEVEREVKRKEVELTEEEQRELEELLE